ncbi:acetyltransferase, ribosomal protein N-acetylase [Leptothrix ochracea L12]|uniref:Acetyltransferase, ribosomal protein N-acetylase n=1 Tax=Leptothrix ochracea L12 TaxID=735332 RepID=I4Z517_9BURK|nr:GNAT family protein [Leptothrix ochracea]EIM31309.1 acetyltransferase, ribosomal protein N-acetylase [Leptothrix ochracea L12]
MNICGKIVTLRAPELADIPDLHRWSNDPEIWRMLGGWHFPFSSRSTEDWVRGRKDGNLTDHVFCIDTPEEGLIGTANLVNIDWKNKNAYHGMMIGKANLRGRGYALDTVHAIMKYAFMELGLHRLDGDMIAYNHRSIKFYIDKCGWQHEGIRRDWFFREGQHHDKVVVGVTREDYVSHVAKNKYWD